MVRHYNLRPVGNKDIRHGYVSVRNGMYFIDKYRNVQRNAVSDNARRMSVENTGRKGVKRKFAIVINNSVSCVRTALEADDNVCFQGQHIRDFTFSFVAPVSAYHCFYHFLFLLFQICVPERTSACRRLAKVPLHNKKSGLSQNHFCKKPAFCVFYFMIIYYY